MNNPNLDIPIKNERLKISLTNEESNVFNLIKEYALTYKGIYPKVVGGWVRDKLLNRQSKDIDICINNITGKEFALGLKNWLIGKKVINVKYAIIEANSIKSKHLETVILTINNLQIDFLNLRTEEYTTSRIPIMKFGSIKEDAERRDLTINAIYYNLITKEVEDYIGGLEDLKAGVLRTPMNPINTFLDDPLRILRIVRFHCILGFSIDNQILKAFEDIKVKTALKEKVSNERIGIEIKKTFENKNFKKASVIYAKADLIYAILKPQIGIENKIFKTKPFLYLKLNEDSNILKENKLYLPKINIKEFSNAIYNLENNSIFGKEIMYEKFLINLYSLLFPFIGIKEGKCFKNELIIKDSLKFTNSISKKIGNIEKNLILLLENYNLFKKAYNYILFKEEAYFIDYLNFLRLIYLMGPSYKETIALFLSHLSVNTQLNDLKEYNLLLKLCLILKEIEDDLFSKVKVTEIMEILEGLNLKGSEIKEFIEFGKIYWNCVNKNKKEIEKLLKEGSFV